MTPQTIDWIEAHKDDDTSALRLKYHGMSEDVSGIDYTYAILQVLCLFMMSRARLLYRPAYIVNLSFPAPVRLANVCHTATENQVVDFCP